jgi:hypothetical protein
MFRFKQNRLSGWKASRINEPTTTIGLMFGIAHCFSTPRRHIRRARAKGVKSKREGAWAEASSV